jgi:hypothetical protein
MDPAADLTNFLAARKGQFFCKRCLGEMLYTQTEAQLDKALRALRNIRTYRTGKLMCHRCSRERECIADGVALT